MMVIFKNTKEAVSKNLNKKVKTVKNRKNVKR